MRPVSRFIVLIPDLIPDPDTIVSEADDLRAAVARQVLGEARVPVDTPPSGVVAEVPDDQWADEPA